MKEEREEKEERRGERKRVAGGGREVEGESGCMEVGKEVK